MINQALFVVEKLVNTIYQLRIYFFIDSLEAIVDRRSHTASANYRFVDHNLTQTVGCIQLKMKKYPF